MKWLGQMSLERVRLSSLICGGNGCGGLVRRPKESRSAFLSRICASSGEAGSRAKVLRFDKSRTTFAPPVIFELGDELWVDDGFHRVALAAYREESTVEATVIRVGSYREADEISELLFSLEHHGAPAWAALPGIAAEMEARHV